MSSVLELYEKLKPKLGDAEARALLEFVETSVEQRAATKEDLQRASAGLKEDLQRTASGLREDLQRTASGLKEDLQRTASGLKEDLLHTEAVLRKEIQEVKVDLLKWSFAFWVGAIAVLSGIIFTMLRSLPAR